MKSEKAPRTKRITIRFTDEEEADLRKAARQDQRDVAEFARLAILKDLKRSRAAR